jgi:hypothetical protein
LNRKEKFLNLTGFHNIIDFLFCLLKFIFLFSSFLYDRTPVLGGLTLREGAFLVEEIAASGCLASMDLVEVNPTLGDEKEIETTLNSAILIIKSALGEFKIFKIFDLLKLIKKLFPSCFCYLRK